MWRDKKGNAMIVVLCVLSVVIILGLSMAAISSNSRSATVKNQHNQQAYYTARSVLDSVVIMLSEKGDPENIAKGLGEDPKNHKQLIAEGDFKGLGSYKVTVTLTAPVERTIVQKPDLDSDGKQKTDKDGHLLYEETKVVSRLPLKITVVSQYKDSAAMVSAYIDGSPVLGQAADGGSDLDKISGDVDPQVGALFEHIVYTTGTIGGMTGIAFEGSLYAKGSIGYLTNCTAAGDIYSEASISTWGGTVQGGLYAQGSIAATDTAYTGKLVANTPLTVEPPELLDNWQPQVPVKALGTVIDATKGPAYIQTSANEISNVTIKGTYPVYIQVTGNDVLKLSSTAGAISGAKDTQVFYICSDSVSQVTIGPTGSDGKGDGAFYGYVYAPKAHIAVDATKGAVEITGALVGNSLTVNNVLGSNKVTLTFREPKGNHPGSLVPVPGESGSTDSDGGPAQGGGSTEAPPDTEDKVFEGYTWQVSSYEGGRSDG